MNLLYPASFEPQPDGGFTVLFRDIPEAITEGDTLDEALLHAQEVLSMCLRGRIEDGQPIPLPTVTPANLAPAKPTKTKTKGITIRLVAPDAQAQSAALLRLARAGRPLSELARALDTSWAAAQRLENPRHWPSLKQLDRAAKVLGRRLVLSFE
jgi:antitoxin HicB